MNVFVLHTDPVLSAVMLCDKHLVKMQLETAQLLSTAYYLQTERTPPGLYDPTHKHHPCTVHLAKCDLYMDWVYENARAMAGEHMRRYNRTRKHLSWFVTMQAYAEYKALDGIKPMQHDYTDLVVPLAMPDDIRGDLKFAPLEQAVELYRQYYIRDKARFAKWTNATAWF